MEYIRQSTDATRKLAEFSANLSYEGLPPEVVHATRRLILDCIIGVAFLGSCPTKGKYAVKVMQELGGYPQATIISRSAKVSANNAAFSNAELLNGTEMEPVSQNFAHFLTIVFPTVLAVAELTEAKGKDFIMALALGYDVAARIGLSLSPTIYLKRDDKNVSKMVIAASETYGYAGQALEVLAGRRRKVTWA